jgi:hypothetical protein
MYSRVIHVHANDEDHSIHSVRSPGLDPDVTAFTIFSKDGRDSIIVNLDEKLRLQLLHALMTEEEREGAWMIFPRVES